MENSEPIKRFFKVFEVLASLILMNLIIILGSLMTLFVLTPIFIYSTFHLLEKMLKLDFDDIMMDLFKDIRRKFLITTKYGYPFILGIGFFIYIFLQINPLIFDYISIYAYGAIIGAQILMLYIFVSILIVSLIYILFNEEVENILEKTFLLIFAFPIRTILAFLSMFVIPGFLIGVSIYFVFLVIPLSLNGYYIILRGVFVKNM